MRKTKWYSYAAALILGVVAFIVLAFFAGTQRDNSTSILSVALTALFSLVVFGFVGYVLGSTWPNSRWRIGLVACAPMVLVLASSVAFSGHLLRFLQKDLTVLAAGVLASCLASTWSSRLAEKREVSRS